MITKSLADRLQSREPPSRARRREMRQYARVRPVAIPRAGRGGDTDALDWRSDPRLLAILARGFNRDPEAREKDELRRDEPDHPARRAVPLDGVRFALGGNQRTDMTR